MTRQACGAAQAVFTGGMLPPHAALLTLLAPTTRPEATQWCHASSCPALVSPVRHPTQQVWSRAAAAHQFWQAAALHHRQGLPCSMAGKSHPPPWLGFVCIARPPHAGVEFRVTEEFDEDLPFAAKGAVQGLPVESGTAEAVARATKEASDPLRAASPPGRGVGSSTGGSGGMIDFTGSCAAMCTALQ